MTRDWHDQLVDPVRAMTIRLSEEQADQLEWVAAVDQQSVTEVIRTAIAKHVEGRRKDEAFQKRLRERITRAQNLLRT